jgi:MFS family permease
MLLVVFFLFTTLSALVVGSRLYARLGGIHMTAIAFLIGAASCVPMLYHISLPAIYAAQAMSGDCYGVTQSVTAGLIIRSVPPAQRGAAMGIFQAIFTVGILFGPVAFGLIAEAASFDAAYWCMTGTMVFAALLCYKLIPAEYKRLT